MTLARLYRFALMALITVFFAVQTASVAHATGFGDDIHEHDGQICVLAAVTAQSVVALVPATIAVVIPQTTTPTLYVARHIDAPRSGNTSRAPPPRGPPA